ncbi:hypothetical protein [Halorubrum vacuolatum]|uniref:Type I phosphodiesterase / nucleotide pyrophosphatase n=1 Tax=Halorubrum vacuolatum TaxID=63740 RepID=A0A238XR76_HALVU|nr:hypothetical protein [Halorubrum vacuolatum]SNR61021.1 hypothetical protein SAMN06264855_12124 [Halorubrum vacuolatum]
MEATGPNPPNLYIKINDSLRYDYGREFFSGLEGTFAKGIAHGNCSPESIPTIYTGVTPDEHGVTGFYESPVQTPTIFDLPRVLPEYSIAYFDHPQDPIVRLLDGPPIKKLTDIEPPFIYIERDLATHVPYGTSWNRILAERELTGDASLNIGVGAENTTRGITTSGPMHSGTPRTNTRT